MKAEFDISIPIPLATIGCAIAWIFSGAHIIPQWGFSFAASFALDFVIGFTIHIRKLGKQKPPKDEWKGSAQP